MAAWTCRPRTLASARVTTTIAIPASSAARQFDIGTSTGMARTDALGPDSAVRATLP